MLSPWTWKSEDYRRMLLDKSGAVTTMVVIAQKAMSYAILRYIITRWFESNDR